MSVSEDLVELTSEMNSFSNTLYAVVLKSWERVAETFDSNRLEGLDLAQVKQRLMAIVLTHTQKLNVNIHNITPAMLGTVSETILRQMIDELQEKNGILPYSFWDKQNPLPALATSTFTSGVYETTRAGGGLCLEDNGDLIVLRNGTDGNVRGVFYSLMEGAFRTVSPTLVNTNAQYLPSSLGKNIPSHIVYGSRDTILGRFCSESDPTPQGWFLGLTQGTFEQSSHKLVMVPFSVIPDTVSGFTIPVKDKVLFFRTVGWAEWEVYEFTVDNLLAGNSSHVKLTGWTVKTSPTTSFVSDTFKFANGYQELMTFTGKPVVYHAMRDVPTSVTYEKKADGTVSVRLRPLAQFGAVDGLGAFVQPNVMIDVVLDGNKVIDSTWMMANKPNVDYTGVAITTGTTGIFSCKHPVPYITHGQVYEYIGRNRHFVVFFNNSTISIGMSVLSFNGNDRPAYLSNYVGYEGVKNTSAMLNFPTPVGMSIHVTCLSPTYVLAHSFGGGRNRITQCRIDTGSQVEFTGITGFPVPGFALNTERVETALPEHVLTKAVVEVNALNGAMLTHSFSVHGGVGYYVSQGLEGMSHSHILNYTTGQKTCPTTVSDSISNVLSLHILSQFPNLYQVGWRLVVPSTVTGIAPFIVFDMVTGDTDRTRETRVGIVTASVQMSGNAISSVAIDASTLTIGPVISGITIGLHTSRIGSVSIRVCADGILIGVTSPANIAYHANSGFTVASFRIANGTYLPKVAFVSGFPTVVSWFNHPTLGMYLVYNSPLGMADAGTKAVGRLYATGSSEVPDVGLAGGPFLPTDRVIVASEVPDKWTMYFSEETECMIDGVYGTVLPMIYPLNPAVDAWKVFHVWLKLSNGTFSYQIERTDYSLNLTDVNIDRNKCLYLGYFTTSRNGIKSIRVEKSIAVGGYRISEWKAGKSIPVSDSLPMDLDTLNWV